MATNLLEDARRSAGLSQDALARLAGTSRPTLSAYEHGRKSPTLATAARLLSKAGFDLAAVPRVGGTNLTVKVRQTEGVRLGPGGLEVQKASAAGVYRKQLSVTRTAAGPRSLRVLVTMDMPEGTAFGYYSIPLVSGTTAQKQDSVKQR